ncbi:MAG: response regulator [Nitrospiraceae bacterium]
MAKILVVDDEEGVRDLLETVLTRKGHHVLQAGTGQRGLTLFRQERPEVTILDLKLPDITGLTVLKAIRTVDRRARVMILTGAGTDTDEVEARALHVTEFLQKGFSLHVLGEALRRVLKGFEGEISGPS